MPTIRRCHFVHFAFAQAMFPKLLQLWHVGAVGRFILYGGAGILWSLRFAISKYIKRNTGTEMREPPLQKYTSSLMPIIIIIAFAMSIPTGAMDLQWWSEGQLNEVTSSSIRYTVIVFAGGIVNAISIRVLPWVFPWFRRIPVEGGAGEGTSL